MVASISRGKDTECLARAHVFQVEPQLMPTGCMYLVGP